MQESTARGRSRHGRNAPRHNGTPGVAIFDFDSTAHGSEYLSLTRGESVILLQCREEDSGWAFGRRSADGREGWFPPQYWTAMSESADAATARDAWTKESEDTALGEAEENVTDTGQEGSTSMS